VLEAPRPPEWRLAHAGAVLIGARAVLIRGPSGAGKSRLGYALLAAAMRSGTLARLVADDYVHLARAGGRLLARAPEPTAGLLERRGIGILEVPHEPLALVGLVVDLTRLGPAQRLPDASRAEVLGVELPRMAFGSADPAAPETILGTLTGFCALRCDRGIAKERAFRPLSPPREVAHPLQQDLQATS